MREFFRPYNKIITIADVNQHIVLLTDSAGAPLASNYVSVAPLSGGGTDGKMFQVIPSGINTLWGGTAQSNGTGTVSGRDAGPSSYANADQRTSNETSGTLGGFADTGAGTVIFSLSPQDSTNALIMSQNIATTCTYGITYGQVNLANTRADNLQNPEELTYSVPTASFTSSVDTDLSTVTFTDTSIGNPYTRNWEFSAVQSVGTLVSNEKTLTHSYIGNAQPPFTAQLSSIGYHGQTTASGSVTF